MYPEAGPSRPGPSHVPSKPPLADAGSSARQGRWDGDYRDDRGNGWNASTPNRSFPNRRPNWPSNFRPSGSRSRTPSPPRRFERDGPRSYDRDRVDIEWRGSTGRGGPTRDWERDRRWNDRDRRDDRFRDRDDLPPRQASSQGPSPPDRISRSPPFGPRGSRSIPLNTPTPYRIPSGPRSLITTPLNLNGSTSNQTSLPSRDLGKMMDNAVPGPGPSTLAQIPRAPRSMRGSSSPVESKRLRNDRSIPSTAPTSTIPLPEDGVKEEADHDLEEGEVLSPVKTVRQPDDWRPPYDRRRSYERDREREWERERDRDRDRDRDRRLSPRRASGPSYRSGRGSLSPQKRRSRSPPYVTGRDLDGDGWGSSERNGDRSNSSPVERRRVVSDGDATTAKTFQSSIEEAPPRPPTPMEPPPLVSNETSSLAIEIKESKEETGPVRPDTPLEPPPREENSHEVETDTKSAIEQSSSNVSTIPIKPKAVGLSVLTDRNLPTRPDTPVDPPTSSSLEVPFRPETPALPPPSPIDPPTFEDVKMRSPSPVAAAIASVDESFESKDNKMLPTEGENGESPSTYTIQQQVDTHQSPSSSPYQTATEQIAAVVNETANDIFAATKKTAPSLDGSPVPTPPALTSPTESAVTPAQPAGQRPVEIEIVVDHSDHDTAQTLPTVTPAELPKPKSPSVVSPSDPVHRSTIAERRSVALPPTNVPLSSPFGDKFPRRDPQPTADSMMESTDAETEYGPRTGDIDMDGQSDISESALAESRQANLARAIKNVQAKAINVDVDQIYALNFAAAPTPSTRIEDLSPRKRDARLRELTWPLNRSQASVAKLVALTIKHEETEVKDKIERLREEYHELELEWKEHCDFLDSLMAKRGPPPADLYATPNALPIIQPGPGPAPTTPIDELFGSRGNRRRGVGDAVTTEAEFEAILAGLADTAAKDPNFRASKTTAVVPDMMLDYQKRMAYDDDNDLVTDPLSYYDFAGTAEPIWTVEERATFLKRYLAHPKQFGKIADHLPEKSASDCVLFYYRTKKTVDYKGMLASRRGDKKKKGLPIKKGGKSSALLADLDRQKPTINPATTPGPRSAITPAKQRDDTGKKGRTARDGVATPGTEGLIRRRKVDDEEGLDSSAGPSRAGSETPSAARSKMRMTVKTAKRPRVSSVNMITGDGTTTVVPTTAALSIVNQTGSPLATTPAGTATAAASATAAAGPPILGPDGLPVTPADLLPPIKRAGKRRKVDSSDPAIEDPSIPKDPNKPRRPATNSYWSVDERKKFRELVSIHGTNHKAIADELQNKSERQVSNFWDSHKLEFEELAEGKEGGIGESELGKSHGMNGEDRPTSGYGAPAPYARSIYDVYPNTADRRDSFEHRFNEPRLGMFPPSPHLAPPQLEGAPSAATATADIKPPAPVRSGGGMRISALLNDDSAESKPNKITTKGNDVDATSDGTVSERDGEGGVARPSPRSQPPAPYPPRAYDDRRAPPIHDRPEYRSANTQPHFESPSHTAGYYPPPPPRAANSTPAIPIAQHRGSWDLPRHQQPPPSQSPQAPPHPHAHPHAHPSQHPQAHHYPPPPPTDQYSRDIYYNSHHRSSYPPPPPSHQRREPDWRYQHSPNGGYSSLPPMKPSTLPPLTGPPPPPPSQPRESVSNR